MSEIQRRLLGVVMINPPMVAKVAALVRPDEFTNQSYRLLYEVMIETVAAGREFDDETLIARLCEKGLRKEHAVTAVVGCSSTYGHVHAWEEYAEAVRAEALWDRTRYAHAMLYEAIEGFDLEARAEAAKILTEPTGGGWVDSSESLQEEVWSRLEGKHGKGLALPFRTLNAALGGGLAPGEVTVIGGWTSHCKSTLAMQIADGLVGEGAEAVYLTNEMRRDEVALRVAAGHGGPAFGTLRQGDVSSEQVRKLFPAMSKMAMKIVDAFSRSVEEICAYIVARRPQLAVIDLFNRLPRPRPGTAELDEQVNRICDAAASSDAHILLVSQLNRTRLSASKELPHPTLGDLRDTGSLATHPANVLFTYLVEQDGIREGYVEVAKARNGRVGESVDVTLNPSTMRLIRTI